MRPTQGGRLWPPRLSVTASGVWDRSELRVMICGFRLVLVSYVVASGGACGHGRLLLRNEEAKPGCHPGQGPSPRRTSLVLLRRGLYVLPTPCPPAGVPSCGLRASLPSLPFSPLPPAWARACCSRALLPRRPLPPPSATARQRSPSRRRHRTSPADHPTVGMGPYA